MEADRLAFRLLAIGLAAAILGGCGAQSGASVVPQGVGAQSEAEKASGKSWMLPGAKSSELLYVSLSPVESGENEILAFSYPQGKLVGGITLPQGYPMGLCSDPDGDLFVTTFGNLSYGWNTNVYEYAHGGTEPIEALTDPGFGNDCAIDATTGNLAVANSFGGLGSFDHGSVVIYQGAQGTAVPYYDSNIYWYQWCVYDSDGNLYVDGYNEGGGYPLAVLPKGSSSFENLTLNYSILPESLQMNGGNLVIAGWQAAKGQPTETLYQIQFSGSEGTIVASTTVATGHKTHKRRLYQGQYILDGQRLIGVGFNDPAVHVWHFPAGGLPTKSIRHHFAYGVALSVAPSRSPIRK